MGTVALHICKGVVGISLTEGAVENLNLGNSCPDLLIGTVVEVAGHVLSRTVGKLDIHRNTLGITAREELRLDSGKEQEQSQAKQYHKD